MAFIGIDGGTGGLPQLDVLIDVTNAPTNTTRVWTSISSKVRNLTWAMSGRNDEFQRTTPGTAQLLLDNTGDGILNLGIKKAQWISIQAKWSGTVVEMWRGILTAIPRQWPSSGKDAIVTVSAADALYILRLWDLMGNTFSSQRGDQRLAAIFALVTPSGTTQLLGTLDTQTDTIDAVTTPLPINSDALTQSLYIEASDNGLLVAQSNGLIDYQGRHWRHLNSATPLIVLGEGGAEIPYRDSVVYEDDDSRMANIVNVTPFGASDPQTATDSAAQTKYFQRRNQTADRQLLSSDTALALSAAQYLVSKYKDPDPRIPAAEIDLSVVGSTRASKMLTLIRDLRNSSRVTWKRNATTPIAVDSYVEQTSHTLQPGNFWRMKVQLSPANNDFGWVLGDSVNGQLGLTTALAY